MVPPDATVLRSYNSPRLCWALRPRPSAQVRVSTTISPDKKENLGVMSVMGGWETSHYRQNPYSIIVPPKF